LGQHGITWRGGGFLGAATVLVVFACVAVLRPPVNATHAQDAPEAANGKQPQPNAAPAAPAPPSSRELIGLARLEARLGNQTPTGEGVVSAHVEGGAAYMPDLVAANFKNITTLHAGGNKEYSGHANATAVLIYGPRGLAPGIRRAYFLSSNEFLGEKFLKAGRPEAPDMKDIRLSNHSWIGSVGGSDEVLRRIDYVADREDSLFVVGVNNGPLSQVPPLLASAYNVLAVGNYYGKSSGGYTTLEGSGRCKPEIVAPGGLTSFATPVVTAAAARLIETADRHGDDSPARKVEVIKAVIMAGAEKPEGWKRAEGKPLDEHYGAGRLRIDTSYDILSTQRTRPGAMKQRYGWGFESLTSGQLHEYTFNANRPMGEASIMLIWNRRIDGRLITDPEGKRNHWNNTPRLGDFNLRLIGVDLEGKEWVAAESAGFVDNLEHIHLPALPAGRYRLEVIRSDTLPESWDYALAWRIENEPRPAAGDEGVAKK